MDRDIKITLSLFLTWVVFGLNNLFGQPQAFVPPIIVDGLMVVGLGIYFCFPFRKNFFYPPIILFSLFILLLSAAELGWIDIPLINEKDGHFYYAISLFLTLNFSLFLLIGSIKYFQTEPFIALIGGGLSILFGISFLFAVFFNPIFGFIKPIHIYIIGGIFCFINILLIKKTDEVSITFKRVMLIVFLNFIFDIGNYLSLLALA